MGTTYARSLLARMGRQGVLKGAYLEQVAFPLGGLGAGCLHLGGAGNLQDFCLFNNPDFGHSPMTFAAACCQAKGRRQRVWRVLEGPVQAPHVYDQGRFGNGVLASGHEGLPHMAAAEFCGEFPFARVTLRDRALPLQVRLEAFSPLIPGDAEASGLPAAFLKYQLRNRSRWTQRVQFSFNVQYPAPAQLHGQRLQDLQGHRVCHRQEEGVAGLWFDSELPATDLRKMSLAVVSPLPDQQANCAWFRGGWYDTLSILAKQIGDGALPHVPQSAPVLPSGRSGRFGATLFWDFELAPGESVAVPVVYCWHVPNSNLAYGQPQDQQDGCGCTGAAVAYRPYYASVYADAWAVARRALEQLADLERRTRRFHRSLFGSTLPRHVLEAVSANLAILKSPTMLRQQDGTLWNWEGCSYGHGCCAGSCTHVWNYAQALPYLFPALERTLRDQELKWSMDERGHVTFRAALPTGPTGHEFHAAADGQLGGVLKLYRDWQLCGDEAWLRERYPLVRRSLEYCIATWDPDEQGVLSEPHHNTYDIEFWGPDVMCSSFYLAALRAMVAMADHLHEDADAARYRALAERGRQYCDTWLWNGEYYHQKVEWQNLRAARSIERWTSAYSPEALALLQQEGPKYQYGTGCLSDGVIGQWYAEMLGLPPALDPQRTRRHLEAVFAHNFRNSLQGHVNPQRPGFALNDEPGLLLCSWPRGGKPALPFVYSDEVWTGIEYQVASHLIYVGRVEEGLSVVRAVRQRYDGRVRNPWNEYECGSYYARALASYALLLALTGFRYSAPDRSLYLAPKMRHAEGRFLFSVDSGWGSIAYSRRRSVIRVAVRMEEGRLEVGRVVVGGSLAAGPAVADLPRCRTAVPGRPLTVQVRAPQR